MLRAMLTTVAALCIVFAATTAHAAEAGKVVSLEGTVEIGRAGAFSPAQSGSVVATGDTIRTGTPGRARILFIDDSVLNVGDGSTLVIDESLFDPNKGTATTLLHLLGGKVRALVSDYYSGSQSSYQIETPTAVSGVRGTEFVMAYDDKKQRSEVLGLGGTTAVNSTKDRRKGGVVVHTNELTEVAKGKYPTPPRQVTTDDEDYRRLMDGLDLPGGGAPESMVLQEPTFDASNPIPQPDSADANVNELQGEGGVFGVTPQTDLPPQEPGRTGGDLLEQPQPVLEAPTDIDIHF